MSFKSTTKKQLFDNIPDNFVDPITNLKPSCETELSALVCNFHFMNKIRWNEIPLYSVDNSPSGRTADHIISQSDILHCEYPLFASEEQIKVWGQMSADIIAYSEADDKVTLIENKIGSTFTSGGGDTETGQLARQIEYLLQCRIRNRNIVLISAKGFFDKYWYSTELNNTLNHKKCADQISGFLIHWEDVFSALKISG